MKRPGKPVSLKRLNDVLGRVPKLKGLRHGDQEVEKWQRDARVAIGNTFGQDSEHVTEFKEISFYLPFMSDRTTDSEEQDWYIRALSRAEVKIQSMIEEIQEYWEDDAAGAQGDRALPHTGKIFLVHGHDEGAKEGTRRFLEKLGLEPVVLVDMPSEGKTIIEKFETHADVGYAIVLLTADDSGARQGEKPSPRARQNVIFELGYFIGRLGRERVCALTTGDPEIPSNYAGVAYIPMEGDSWQMPLMRELKATGLDVDANKALD